MDVSRMTTENEQEGFDMLKDMLNGFCMALADSVPGVSGGTVAFIMGFYDKFIGSINDFVFGKMKEKKNALGYLAKLGCGWAVGMILAVLALSALFENHIYTVSSLFIGFIVGSIPLVIKEEKDSFREVGKGIAFGILGIALVVGISLLNGSAGAASMDLSHFSLGLGIKLFFYRHGCDLGNVPSGNLGFDTAPDLRRVYTGHYGDQRGSGTEFAVCSLPDVLWLRYPGRGGNGGRNAVPEGCFFRQEECFAFTVNYIRSK